MVQKKYISIQKLKSDTSDIEEPQNFRKHQNFYDDMASFDKKTVQFIKNLHFNSKITKFVFGCIPSFDVNISGMKTNVEESPSITG